MTTAHKRLVKAVMDPTLPECVIEETLFFVKVLVYARRGKTTHPTPEQWSSYPLWVKWRVFVVVLFWAKFSGLKEKLFIALARPAHYGRCSAMLRPRNETQNEKPMYSSDCKKNL